MNIFVNGTPIQVEESMGMTALIERLDLAGRRIAIEVNAELVPRSRFPEHRLSEGDRVEIIHAVGGG